jgi:hypothetical protein
MDPELSLDRILNVRFALRRLLLQEKYQVYDTSVPKGDIVPEKEPYIRAKLSVIAKQILDNSNTLLSDVYNDNERMMDWIGLVKKKVMKDGDYIPIDTRTRPGHKILDHHMTHFYDVKNYKGISVRSLLSQELLEKALITNISMHSTPYKSEIRRMITMTGGLGNVTKYRTVTSKAIVEYYDARRILDPCVGWGGRMLGALSAFSDTYYVGCEPDPMTAKCLDNILNDTAIPASVRSRAIILSKPAEDGLRDLKRMVKFDLILTSPPYFNLELYTGGEQSTNNYNTWEEWTENWLKVVILGCLSCLKPGGRSCWSVKNFKSDKKYLLADVTKQIHKDAGWELDKVFKMTGSGRPGGDRIANGTETRESEEETFCFRRAVVT